MRGRENGEGRNGGRGRRDLKIEMGKGWVCVSV